jgi:hypothetical protein
MRFGPIASNFVLGGKGALELEAVSSFFGHSEAGLADSFFVTVFDGDLDFIMYPPEKCVLSVPSVS